MSSAPPTEEVDLGEHYARSRNRLCALLDDAGEGASAVAVPACPGWTVHDVVAHLVGNIEDGAADRLQGIPTDDQTWDQVARHRKEPLSELVARPGESSPR